MKWKNRRRSTNVEDRRGQRVSGGPRTAGGAGITQLQTTQIAPAPNDEMQAFLSTLKADNEDVWSRIFQSHGQTYRPAKLVIYNDKTIMPGGIADARMGPLYLPTNSTVYIDPNFFNEMKQRFGAPGDFAQVYVVAHDIGHHVQHLLGFTDHVQDQRGRVFIP